MSTTIETKARLDVEAMTDFEGISRRFLQDFDSFVIAKKRQAVHAVLKDEAIVPETLVRNPDFIEAIVNRVDDEALLEKRYIFISVNPQAIED